MAVAAIGGMLLAGCSTQTSTDEERMGSLMVAPGKYQFFTCAHLAAQTVNLRNRERELEALIARAGTDAGGSVASAVAYRPELIQARGNLAEVRREEVSKNCPAPQVAEAPARPAAANTRPKRR